MDNFELLNTIRQQIIASPLDIEAYEDFFQLNRIIARDEFDNAVKPTFEDNLWLRRKLTEQIRKNEDANVTVEMYELLKRTYLYMAKDDFESYMIFLEWNRPPQERFYQPRAKVMKPLVEAIQALVDGELNELFLSMPPRVGKALANDTPILTPDGWKKHGDLKVGDKVFRPNGETAEIIHLNPKCQMTHRITMTDGSTFDCHENHEWRVWDRRFGKERVLETHELIGHLENGGTESKRGHRYNFQLLPNQPLVGIRNELPVKPYTFGAWLGDGNNIQPRINGDKNDRAIIDGIVSDGYSIKHVYTHATTGVITTDFGSELRKGLNSIGLCHYKDRRDKYIPEIYLTASLDQRLELLAGLLDTDGCLRKKEHRYDFTTSDEKLKDGVITLISTFGWRVSIKKIEPSISTSGIIGKKSYWAISFNPTFTIPCRLERKQLNEFSKQRRIAIKSIEPLTEYVEGNCITLDNFDGMYLAGDRLTPTHNTTMIMFLVTWLIGRDSEKSNLYSAFSDTITKALYNGVLEVLNDPSTYLWHEVFPMAIIASTNSQDETLNLDRKKRYPSLTARSLYGTLNGACDCNGFMIADDLIGGIEEALNKDRLTSAWSKVDNNLIPRCKESARMLWVGTRWSIADPTGRRLDALRNDRRFKNRKYRVINLPALNEYGGSNFNYDYGVGFSTEYYQQRKASFEHAGDEASWYAQYQGEPVERSGVLFEPAELKYFNGDLPDEEHLVRKLMAVDPAFGGGDFVAAPIAYQYDDGTVFIVDVVYSNAAKNFTQPLLAERIRKWEVGAAQFECNKSTAAFKEKVEDILHARNYKLNITYKSAPNNVSKEIRIFDKAPEIKEFYFLEGAKRSSEYEQFMQNVFSFQINGNNKHDDAPDSLAMLVEMMDGIGQNIKIMRRWF